MSKRTLADIQQAAARISEGIPLDEQFYNQEPVDEWKKFNDEHPGDMQKFTGTKLFKVLLEAYQFQLDTLTKRLYVTKDTWEIAMIQGKIHTYRSIITNYEYLIKISTNK